MPELCDAPGVDRFRGSAPCLRRERQPLGEAALLGGCDETRYDHHLSRPDRSGEAPDRWVTCSPGRSWGRRRSDQVVWIFSSRASRSKTGTTDSGGSFGSVRTSSGAKGVDRSGFEVNTEGQSRFLDRFAARLFQCVPVERGKSSNGSESRKSEESSEGAGLVFGRSSDDDAGGRMHQRE